MIGTRHIGTIVPKQTVQAAVEVAAVVPHAVIPRPDIIALTASTIVAGHTAAVQAGRLQSFQVVAAALGRQS